MQKVSNVERQKSVWYEKKKILSQRCSFTSGLVPYQPSVFAVMSFQLPWLRKRSFTVEEGAHEALTRIFETFSHLFTINSLYLGVFCFCFVYFYVVCGSQVYPFCYRTTTSVVFASFLLTTDCTIITEGGGGEDTTSFCAGTMKYFQICRHGDFSAMILMYEEVKIKKEIN